MKGLILVRYGEIALKGQNRKFFIGLLIRNIRKALDDIEHDIVKDRGRILVKLDTDGDIVDEAITRLSRVFGIVSVSKVIKTHKDIDSIAGAAARMVNELKPQSFKVEARRADKSFRLESPEISRRVGAFILDNCQGVRVDLHNPETVINIEIRDKAYIFSETERGPGGLPTGSSGSALLLLSGGIDSPVAGWMLAKRGVEIQAVHYHSFPFTSDRAKQKVIDLAHVLSGYTGGFRLHLVSLTNIQQQINAACPEEQGTILTRRFMMKIARGIAAEEGLMALITGESLGQVASQTMESLYVTNASVDLPVFRPLIGMDKVEIMEKARNIGTYDLSILPYEDCCTLFLPKYPETKPKIERVLQSESHLDVDGLVKEAIDTREVMDID
jgi:thiamine biosynthesis protein ThiI